VISYRLPGGKQKRAPVKGKDLNPYSIEDARKMHSKRVVQKAENKILDIKPDTKMTFNEMAEWYLSLEKVKALKSYEIEGNNIKKFNEDFGNRIVGTIKPAELENYQAQKIAEGVAEATIDHKIGVARRMVKKAFLHDLVGGGTRSRPSCAFQSCARGTPTPVTGSSLLTSSAP